MHLPALGYKKGCYKICVKDFKNDFFTLISTQIFRKTYEQFKF